GPEKIDLLHHAADAGVDGVVIVAQHDGAESGVVVDVIIAVRIRYHRALRAHEDELRPAPSERSVDAPGHDLACGAVSLLTLGEIEHVFSSRTHANERRSGFQRESASKGGNHPAGWTTFSCGGRKAS